MRAVLLALLVAGCSSSTKPDDGACRGYGCDALKNDIVREPLLPWPDSIDPATGLPYPDSTASGSAPHSPRVTTP